jgi:hypothetical protein
MKQLSKLVSLAVIAGSFVFLAGWHGGCRQLTPEEKVARLERHSIASVDDLMDDVDADLKQRAQAQAIRKRLVTAATPLIIEQEKAKELAYQQWDSPSPDREQIHQVVDERVDAFRKFLHLAADGVIELHQLLTPEQRAEVAEYWKD